MENTNAFPFPSDMSLWPTPSGHPDVIRGFSSSSQQHTPRSITPHPHSLYNSLFTCRRGAIHRVLKHTPPSERMTGKMGTSLLPDLKYCLFNLWTNSHNQVTLLVAMDTQVKGF